MNQRISKEDKQRLHHVMRNHAVAFLKKKPVISIAEFEEEMLKRFPELAGIMGVQLASGRSEGLNLVDWVKAWLTRTGRTRTFQKGKEPHIAYIEPCGSVEGKPICWASDVHEVLRELFAMLSRVRSTEPQTSKENES